MRHTFELSERTKKLVAFLRYVEKGTEISYRDLAQQIGEPVDAKSSTYARLVLLRDFAAVFACLPRIGLRRLTDLEIADRLPSFWLITDDGHRFFARTLLIALDYRRPTQGKGPATRARRSRGQPTEEP